MTGPPSYARRRLVAGLALLLLAATTTFVLREADDAEGGEASAGVTSPSPSVSGERPAPSSSPSLAPSAPAHGLQPNVYAAIATHRLSPSVRGIRPLVYVPNNTSNTVDVIDPKTFKVIRHFDVGYGPQHITPAWNLQRLYVGNTYSNTVTVIDPRTGRPTGTIHVFDTYNLYFTPDGTRAIDVAERMNTLYFYDWHTWKVVGQIHIPWPGADHLDFSADGRFLLLSTEYAGRLVKIDVPSMKITRALDLGGSPVDVKVAPDGSVFFVANQVRGGVSVVDPERMKELGFIPTGRGAHGFCVARDARRLYVSNRLAGTISVIRFTTRTVVHTWNVGGSPDMMQVSPDGRELWVSNRFDGTVSVIDTRSGKVLHVIRVGASPHGLTYFPQPGRFSIGHNGVYR